MFSSCTKISNKIFPFEFESLYDTISQEDIIPKYILRFEHINNFNFDSDDNQEQQHLSISLYKNNFSVWCESININKENINSYYLAFIIGLDRAIKYNVEDLSIESSNSLILELLQKIKQDKIKDAQSEKIQIFENIKKKMLKFEKINILRTFTNSKVIIVKNE